MAGISNAVDGGHAVHVLTSDLDQTPDIGTHMTTSRFGYHPPRQSIWRRSDRPLPRSVGIQTPVGRSRRCQFAEFALGHPVARRASPAAFPFHLRRSFGAPESRLGEDNYRLLTNNCEHFCSLVV